MMCAICLSMLAACVTARAAECCGGSAAIIASITGEARVRSGAASSRVAILDRLGPGVTIETGAKSAAVVLLGNGRRWELGERARASVDENVITPLSGPIRELPRLPPIPKPAPIAGNPGDVPGAVRFRGPSPPRSLYPFAGASVLRDSVRLSFSEVPGASLYRVVLADGEDSVLWRRQTASTSVAVPANLVKPGGSYVWHVQAMGQGAVLGEADARFAALSSQTATDRRNFAAAISAQPGLRALLASIDLQLGLFAEAVDEFSDALRDSPGDPDLQRALTAAKSARAGGEK